MSTKLPLIHLSNNIVPFHLILLFKAIEMVQGHSMVLIHNGRGNKRHFDSNYARIGAGNPRIYAFCSKWAAVVLP